MILSQFKFLLKRLILFYFLILTGCLPENQSLDQSLKDSIGVTTTLGFRGLESVQTITGSKLQLSWNESTDPNVVAYNIYDTTNMFNPVLVATIPAPSTGTFLTKTAGNIPFIAGSYYSFRVNAVTAKQKEDDNLVNRGAIPYSGVISYQILDGSTVKLTLNNASNADRAKAFCKVGLSVVETEMGTLEDVSKTELTLTGLTAGTQYVCRVALEIGSFVDNNKTTVTFTPLGLATRLVFLNQPGNGQAGVLWGSQPVVAIQDDNGNTVAAGPDATAGITLTISSGAMSGTVLLNAVNGVATFTGISTSDMGVKVLTATKEDKSGFTNGAGVLTVDSNQFTIAAGPVSPLFSTISVSPLIGTAPLVANGVDTYSVKISLKDQFGNPVTGVLPQFSSSIVVGDTLTQPSVATNSSGESEGSLLTTVADEVSPFRKLAIKSPSGLSDIFVMAPFVPGPAVKLGFTVQPTYSQAGLSTFQVSVLDVNGNVVRSSNIQINVGISSATNGVGATLSGGSTSVNAVNGVAVFSGLFIDKSANGYKLTANAGSLTEAISSPFNVTAGTASKLVIAGVDKVKSGSCGLVKVQMQDIGGNLTKPASPKTVLLSGLGSAKLYSGATCTGSPLNAGTSLSMTFTTAQNEKSYYIKSDKGEQLNLSATEANLTTGTKVFNITPSQIKIVSPASVIAGNCSSALVVTPMGVDNAAAPIASSSTVVAVTGLGATAKLYSDVGCTTEVNPMSVTLPVTVGGNFAINYYVKSDKSELLSTINISDTSVVDTMSTASSAQSLTVLPSDIELTGPSQVVAGQCSSAYTVKLKDKLSQYVSPTQSINLKVSGLSGKQGKFYTNSNCTSAVIGNGTTVVYPSGAGSLSLYFKDVASESLSVSVVDALVSNPKMSDSNVINIGVSPSALRLSTAIYPEKGNTSVCMGPIVLNTMDGQDTPAVTNAITPVTVNLSTSGYAAGFSDAGSFYSDASCVSKVTSVVVNTGESAKNLYFKSQYPGVISLVASDAGSVLASGSLGWEVVGAKGFLGGMSKMFDNTSTYTFSFKTGVKPVQGRFDAPYGARSMAMSPDKKFLYVADESNHRVLKYDYENQRYVGWIGRVSKPNGSNSLIGLTGSQYSIYSQSPYNIADFPTAADCRSRGNGDVTPGWCLGGLSLSTSSNTTNGSMSSPNAIVADHDYIYVAQAGANSVLRYKAGSGAFAGWIGRVYTNPTATADGNATNCAVGSGNPTPGWCMGGDDWESRTTGSADSGRGDVSMNEVSSLAIDDQYLYIGQRGAVLRVLKTDGSFQGWIGRYDSSVQIALPTDAPGSAGGCSSLTTGQTSPGWCLGGGYYVATDTNQVKAGGIGSLVRGVYADVQTDELFVATRSSLINVYTLSTGAFKRNLTQFNHDAYNMVRDSSGTNMFIAAYSRVIAVKPSDGQLEGWMGKVSNASSMFSALDNSNNCSNLSTFDNTPGWCAGGTGIAGADEGSFQETRSIVDDGQGHLLIGTGRTYGIRKFKKTTGQYLGTMTVYSNASDEWMTETGDSNLAQRSGVGDQDFNGPLGSYNDGQYLYVADGINGRIKKIELATGKVIGWVGAVTTKPTGGANTSCLTESPMTVVNRWCLGSIPNLWFDYGNVYETWRGIMAGSNFLIYDGYLVQPTGITGDGTYLYVTDRILHRINKYRADSGEFIGWVGLVGTKPTGYHATLGHSDCVNTNPGSVTPGWCKGGISQNGTGDGSFNQPSGITHHSGFLYIVDSANHRVVKVSASTGITAGWIGRIGTAQSGGCTPVANGSGYNVSGSGWCIGGTAAVANGSGNSQSGIDRGGGFNFWVTEAVNGIATDGTYLYISNLYNFRIDRFTMNGEWNASTRTKFDLYTGVWSSDPAVVGSWNGNNRNFASSLTVDQNNIYVISYHAQFDASNIDNNNHAILRIDKATGTITGWQGGVHPNRSITGGDTTSCQGTPAGNITPSWCKGGAPSLGYSLGQFSEPRGISHDNHYIYVTDYISGRITRLPK